MLTMITRILKTIAAILIFSALLSLTAKAQQFNQNVQYTKLASYTGRPEVKDTSFWMVNGTDTLRITTYGDTVRFISTAAAYKFTPEITITPSKEIAFGSNGWVQYNLNDSLYADTLFTRSSTTNNTWIAKLAQADTAAQLFVGNYLGALNAAGYGYGSYNSATGLGAFSAAFKAGSTINNTMYSGGKGQTNTNAIITTVNVTNNQGTTSAYSSYLSDSTRAVLYLSAQETDSATFPAALSYKRSGAQRGFYVDNQTPGWFIRGGTKFRLPVTDGSAGYALTTNGSGTLSFSNLGATYWSLQGNADITDANFLGTTNTDSLRFQLNGNPWGCLDNANYSVSLGAYAGIGSTGNQHNIMLGFSAGQNGAGANFNIGIGYQALSTATGINSVAIGYNSGYNSTGDNKILLGTNSGIANIGNNVFGAMSNAIEANTGNNVIGIGDSAAQTNTGNHVIALGKNAGKNNTLDNILIVSDTIKNLKLSLGTDSIPCYSCVLKNDSTGNATWSATAFTPADSVTIYALIPDNGTTYYCTDCSGNGVTGRIVSFFGAAWRRQLFE